MKNIDSPTKLLDLRENIQYCRIARGSLTETIDHLEVASECGYISRAKQAEIKIQLLID